MRWSSVGSNFEVILHSFRIVVKDFVSLEHLDTLSIAGLALSQ